MTTIIPATQMKASQLKGLTERQSELQAPLTAEEIRWVEEVLDRNLRTAFSLAYHKNESFMQMQFTEDCMKTHLRYARQARAESVKPHHALNTCTRELFNQLYNAGYAIWQEYQDGELPGTLWSYRGPQRLMLRWS